MNNSTNCYRIYSLGELRLLANASEPTPANLILDRKTIDFLLSLNTGNRPLNPATVDAFLRSYEKVAGKAANRFL